MLQPDDEGQPPKFNIGDKVMIINYGHLGINKYEMVNGMYELILGVFDYCPEIVGKVGVIEKVDKVQGFYHYAIGGIPGKHAWYDDGQLEKTGR